MRCLPSHPSFQETFDAGLQAFQQEGIANITALKDQLLAAKHVQSKAIEARHAALMKRWSQLLANSATRKKKLLEAQSHFRKVEDLFLTFAQKASAFNSWFENAKEDLTDPVRCNSLEEIKALREAHDAFRSSLSSAQANFNQLAELDRQIKSFRVASNPYTWFTMEALEETWRNLQKIIKVLPHRRARPWQGSPSSVRSKQSGTSHCVWVPSPHPESVVLQDASQTPSVLSLG